MIAGLILAAVVGGLAVIAPILAIAILGFFVGLLARIVWYGLNHHGP